MLIKRTKPEPKKVETLSWLTSYSLQTKLMIVMNIALIGGAFALGFLYGQLRVLKSGTTIANVNTGTNAQVQQAPPEGQPLADSAWKSILVDPVAAKGPSDAAVTIVEFTDYQCPFCEQYYTQTQSSLMKDFVDSGKVRYIIRDLPLPFHPNAHIAAEAARCAGDQNKYWEMHEQLFGNQNDWVSLSDPKAKFGEYAQTIGLNVSKFNQCVSSGQFKQAVDDDLNLATSVGANGTPTFYINGTPLVGAQPYAAFQTAINAAMGT